MREPERILIAVMDRLGDVTNTTPAIAAVRARFPHARITVEARAPSAQLLADDAAIDELWLRTGPNGLLGLGGRMRRIRRGRFDAVYMLDCDNYTPLIARLCAIPRRYGAIKSRYRRLCTDFAERIPNEHECIGPFMRLLKMTGVEVNGWFPRLTVAPFAIQRVEGMLTGLAAPVVGVVVGASAPARIWTPTGFTELAQWVVSLGGTPVLIGRSEDRAVGRIVAGRCPSSLNLTGEIRVAELVALIGRCHAVISGDTGPMHIACALHVPCVALYGPSNPDETGPAELSRCRIVRAVDGTMASITVHQVTSVLETIVRSEVRVDN